MSKEEEEEVKSIKTKSKRHKVRKEEEDEDEEGITAFTILSDDARGRTFLIVCAIGTLFTMVIMGTDDSLPIFFAMGVALCFALSILKFFVGLDLGVLFDDWFVGSRLKQD